MKSTTTFFSCFFLLIYTSFAQDSVQVMTSWIQQSAIPIKHIEAGNGFSDLQPLKQILKDVRVVGLGESTHGTREMFQVKHRLLEFLVTEMGFTAFALEAPYSSCQPINEYVLNGHGNLETVLTGQGYVVWDTQEMAEMIAWLRKYNQGVPEEKKVKFFGLDLAYNEIGRKAVLRYLGKVAPERIQDTDSLFRILAKAEAKWPTQMTAETEKTLLHVLPRLQDLIDFLTLNKESLVSKSSPASTDETLQYVLVMKKWLFANTKAVQPPFIDGSFIRSVSMAENLIYLMEQAGPEAKFVVWEHNSHLAKSGWNGGANEMGYQLQKKYGAEYYAFSIEYFQGSFQTRTKLPDNKLAEHKVVDIPPAPMGSFPWYLNRSDVGNLILNLREPVTSPVVKQWLHSTHKVYLGGWVYGETDYIQEVEIMKQYDGIIFIEKTTPTRPTTNALKSAANREGL